MQFQLSIFYEGGMYSYKIHSEDRIRFDFALASSPAKGIPVPQKFTALISNSKQWTVQEELDKAFKEAVIKTMKKTKL